MQVVRMTNVTEDFIKDHDDYLYVVENEISSAPLGLTFNTEPLYAFAYPESVAYIDQFFDSLKYMWEKHGKPPVVIPYGFGDSIKQRLAPDWRYLNAKVNSLILSKLYERYNVG